MQHIIRGIKEFEKRGMELPGMKDTSRKTMPTRTYGAGKGVDVTPSKPTGYPGM